MPHAARDRSYQFPVSMDPRKHSAIWTEACKNERGFQRRAPNPTQLAAARGGSDVKSIQDLTANLEKCSADFIWSTEDTSSSPKSTMAPAVQMETSAMAELAMGVGDAESNFLRRKPDDSGMRRARPVQHPTMAPWQMGTDCSYWQDDALKRWMAKQRADVLVMPALPTPLPRKEATISGPHAASVPAWRNNAVPLSQWEISERGEALCNANKLAAKLDLELSKDNLSNLLMTALKVSDSHPSPTRGKWFER